jgi:predicted nucleic acid-binding protein
MKCVLDASEGIKWVMNEVDSTEARDLRDDFRNQIHRLIALDSFPREAAHALTSAGRRGIVTDATKLWVELMVDSPQLFPSVALMLSRSGHRPPSRHRCLRLPLGRLE